MNIELEKMFNELSTTGMTIIKSFLSTSLTDKLKKIIINERRLLENRERESLYRISPFLASPAHIGFMCPLQLPFCDKDIIIQESLYALLEKYLGKNFYLHEYVTNIALAGVNTTQTPHPDQEVDKKGPVGVVCNIALDQTNEKNGMTNMWLKTHKKAAFLSSQALDEQYQSIQPSLEAGDILIRDISLIHQGMPNEKKEDRYLLALVFKAEREKISSYAISKIPRDFWDICSPVQQSLLRFHAICDEKKVLSRSYPSPKKDFSAGY